MNSRQFKHWFHASAAVEFRKEVLPKDTRFEQINAILGAFIQNVERVLNSGVAPISLVSWSLVQQAIIDEACFGVWQDLKQRDATDPQFAEYDKELKQRQREWLRDASESSEAHRDRLWRAACQLELFQDSPEIRSGMDAILSGMITGMWTAFEVLASDIWEAALNIHPTDLARLSGRPPQKTPKAKAPFTALGPDVLSNEVKMVKLNYLQAHGYDLSKKMGTVLSERFSFQKLEGIQEAYIQAFDKSHVALREAILHPSLAVLSSVRNLLIHRAGVVDAEFMRRYHNLKELRIVFPGAEEGDVLQITGQTVRSVLQPALQQSTTLIQSVVAYLDS